MQKKLLPSYQKLCDSILKEKDVFENDITREAKDCDEQEIHIIADTIKALKETLRRRK